MIPASRCILQAQDCTQLGSMKLNKGWLGRAVPCAFQRDVHCAGQVPQRPEQLLRLRPEADIVTIAPCKMKSMSLLAEAAPIAQQAMQGVRHARRATHAL